MKPLTQAPHSMHARITGVLAFLILTFSVLAASAAERSPAQNAANCSNATTPACRYAKGLLWKIERAGTAPSFLFGTIHIADPRVTNLPPAVQQRFDASKSFTMEAIIDMESLVQMMQSMIFSDDRTLEKTVGPERYAEIRRVFTKRQLPTEGLNLIKPWAIDMQLSTPSGGVPLDLMLYQRATQLQKPTHGLETIAEQVATFDELPMDTQIAMLDHTLRHESEFTKLLESMVLSYLARDLAGIIALTDDAPMPDARLQQLVMDRLLTQRNVRMAERMRPRLQEGNAFIAIGAAHLPGERGVLALLERAGYRVTVVY